MHPSDNIKHAMVSPPFNNQKYHSWCRLVLVALRSKNKLGFLDQTLTCHVDTCRPTIAWDKCSTMVIAWVTNSIYNDIALSIIWMDTTHEIWVELKDWYHQGDVFSNC